MFNIFTTAKHIMVQNQKSKTIQMLVFERGLEKEVTKENFPSKTRRGNAQTQTASNATEVPLKPEMSVVQVYLIIEFHLTA